MKKIALRILALAMLLALTVGALPALAAAAKIVPETLYTQYEYGWLIRFENLPSKARITSVTSSKPKVIKTDGDSTWVEPLKAGKSTLTVKYKVGKKRYTLKQKYTVAPYYRAVKSLRINGDKQNVTKGQGRVYCAYYDWKATRYRIELKPASGWKIDSIHGIYTEEDREDVVLGHFYPKKDQVIKVPLDRMAYVIYTLKNTRTGKTFDYNVGLTRFGE